MTNDAVVPSDDLPPVPGDSSICSLHPYRPNLGGGICATCLKDKLGKLISSSSSSASSSSSSSTSSITSAFPLHNHHRLPSSSSSSGSPPSSKPTTLDTKTNARRTRIPGFLYPKKKKINRKSHSPAPAASRRVAELPFRRSNTAPKRPDRLAGFLDGYILDHSPRKKGFWSFFYLSASNHLSSSVPRQRQSAPGYAARAPSTSTSAVTPTRRADGMFPFPDDASKRRAEVIPEADDEAEHNTCRGSNFDRKVSRSKSVGCGSRSFSGDFFERISTGFGDCTFRRVESQREPNDHGDTRHRVSSSNPDYCMKNRVRCGRIFGGFMTVSSDWITADSREGHRSRVKSAAQEVDGRSRSWGGWVFASPMRTFGRPAAPKEVKSRDDVPNLNGIPSLQAVGG